MSLRLQQEIQAVTRGNKVPQACPAEYIQSDAEAALKMSLQPDRQPVKPARGHAYCKTEQAAARSVVAA